MNKMSSWSYSKLTEFERCKYRTFLLHVDKTPEPQRPLPPGKTEHANDRGIRVHLEAEQFIKGEGEMTPELLRFKDDFHALAEQYKQGKVSLEGEWGMDEDWNITDWQTAWLRLKLDALVLLNEEEAVAIDFKTGKKYGNEIKHAEQLQLYQLVTFLRYPKLEKVTAELWYLDIDEITSTTYTRAQGLRAKEIFARRGKAITNCTTWPTNPSLMTCKWCMYGKEGICPDRVHNVNQYMQGV